jgi:murein DD-endopeptidase MepM/ murein hydrolase activator NlpD
MSRRSPYQAYHHHHHEHSGRRDERLRPAAAGAGGPRGRDYTFAHAGRQLRLGPIAFWVVVGTLVIMAAWTITTATYFAFRDDVLTRLIARQANMQFGYEDRIAELRVQIDRISSRQLLDQEQYEQKLEQILRRQATLESRATAFSGLPDPTPTGSIRPASRKANETSRGAPHKPSPVGDKGAFMLQSDSSVQVELAPRLTGKTPGSVDDKLASLQASLDRIEQRQGSTLVSLEESLEYKARRIRGVLVELGLEKKDSPIRLAGIGGPFIPVKPASGPGGFDHQLSRLKQVRAQVDRMTRRLSALPVRKPLTGSLDVVSGFGVRSDPFTRSAAMHTGLDFQSQTGTPVHVTANGTVKAAGWSGGYGKAIDVDHGNGYVTRYGHLSAIDVKVGQTVKAGQIIGKVGSTGRSTGPHLHYETRIGREAVDPERFLRAGAKLEGHI